MKQYLSCARAVNTHGVAGLIKLESWCDSPKVLADIKTLYLEKGGEYIPKKVEKSSVFKNMVLCKLEGCNTFEDAILFKNQIFYCDRSDLDIGEDKVFIEDIIGLEVINADTKKVYGVLENVINNPANDIYEIKTPTGIAYMPAVNEFIASIDTEKGIFVRPIEGMFDEI
ncbi:MAG: 16S rRNA processing protein RimM [Ruminococcaceae bacterium]|nr:16S rRNA processing protein RimM [Oscillospiraceae bacterium]